MAKKRVTFSEHWYRVADLRPRLIPAVRIHKQFFRGREWHVLRSPVNQEFFRLDAAAYGFIGLLDGRRTVAEVWKAAVDRCGDDAPTQNEAIQLIGQLYTSNLIQAEIPPDSESLFQRYRKRRNREIQGAAMSFLFPRFRLWDPHAFLKRWVGLTGWLFTWKGMVLWLILVVLGLNALAGNADALFDASSGVLSPGNLPLLYGAFVLAKAVHEAGHAFACTYLGTFERGGGQVHNTGLMLLLFTPAPYVDATSSWGFRNKWRRIMVGAAGVWAELALAAVAAIIWSQTGEGTALHGLAYNLMFVASVSTLLFNGNPLLRYDAYYILCDWLEMPNLAGRGQQYVYYLVKRYLWGARDAVHQATSGAEKALFLIYTIASNIYRVFLLSGILLTIADMAFFVGIILALGSLVLWLVLPIAKFLRYLAVSPELARVRFRAVATTAVLAAGLAGAVGLMPYPDRFRIEGVVEAEEFQRIHAVSAGFIRSVLASEETVAPGETVLVRLDNPTLEAEWRMLAAREKEILALMRLAEATDPAEVAAAQEQFRALQEEKRRVRRLLDNLEIYSTLGGIWVAPRLEARIGGFVELGEPLGHVLARDRMIIRSVPGQDAGVSLIAEAAPVVDLMVKGRPDLRAAARIRTILPGGRKQLPSPALGYPAGGETAVDAQDQSGLTPEEHVFEITLDLAAPDWQALPGQVVIMRFSAAEKPLAQQAWRTLLQLLQRRFHV